MTNKRPLLPAVQSLPNASRSVGTGLVNDDNNREALTEIPPPSKRRRHRHSAQAWAEQRELFTVLYHHNKKSIKNVIQLIEEERGFKASLRSWKDKIKEWKLSKYDRNEDLKILAAKRKERQDNQNSKTRFIKNGAEITNDRLDRFEKRTEVNAADGASPSMPTPAGVVYDTPSSGTSKASPFNASDVDFLSQVEHHFQTIQPVTIIKVQKANSQLCSKCRVTPYDNPKESPDYVDIVRSKKCVPSDVSHFDFSVPLDKSGRRTSVKKSTGKSLKRADARSILQKPTQLVCWKCHKSRDIEVSKHMHRMGDQGIAYRGPEITGEKPMELLWQARNLALELCGTFRQNVRRESTGQYSSQDTLAPQVWAPAGAINDIGVARFQRLLNFVKHSAFFTSLFDPCYRDRKFWIGSWRLMVDLDVSEIETLALKLFGDPSVPYPDMNLFTMLIRFDLFSPIRRPVLLRIVLGIESQVEIFNCEVCASDFMMIDSMDHQSAVKLHIPLNRTKNAPRCDDWRDFSTQFETKASSENLKWTELGYIHQGWTEQSLLREAKDDIIIDEFDENGLPAHIRQFQPFQADSDWEYFGGVLIGSRIYDDSDSKSDAWDATDSESDDQFDPFLTEHSRRLGKYVVRDEWQ